MVISTFAVLITNSAILFGITGVIVGFVIGRRSRQITVAPSIEISTADPVQESLNFDSMMADLQDLTTDMKTQVGQHSARIDEITQSIESADIANADMVLSAGRELVSANEHLQIELAEAKAEIERQRSELQKTLSDARTDVLTSLPNRRAFDQEITRALAHYRRKSTTFSLMMLDIDHFKRLNDQHGHMVGDQVLKTFARSVIGSLRETDFVSRFGGEEFAVILPRTELSDALIAAERARFVISRCNYTGTDVELRVTASIGVAEIARGETEAELIKRADAALYEAKKGGRNRCFVHEGPVITECPKSVSNAVAEASLRCPTTPKLQSSESVIPRKGRRATDVIDRVWKHLTKRGPRDESNDPCLSEAK